jgi:hypothetical protein
MESYYTSGQLWLAVMLSGFLGVFAGLLLAMTLEAWTEAIAKKKNPPSNVTDEHKQDDEP